MNSQSNAQSSREKLIEELERKLSNPTTSEEIADFILKDRERICEPIVRFIKMGITVQNKETWKAMQETLRLAGVNHG